MDLMHVFCFRAPLEIVDVKRRLVMKILMLNMLTASEEKQVVSPEHSA